MKRSTFLKSLIAIPAAIKAMGSISKIKESDYIIGTDPYSYKKGSTTSFIRDGDGYWYTKAEIRLRNEWKKNVEKYVLTGRKT